MKESIIGEEWQEYYDMFPYFSHEKIRRGCYPWKMINSDSERAIVLVHGLSDSPYYLKALAKHFYNKHSCSVFIPLLQCHGLKEPEGMKGVNLEEWKKNVSLSVEEAATYGEVSIGGLSTGGTLSLYAMETMEQLTGCLYLFSAALALSGGMVGRFKGWLIRTKFADLLRYFDRNKALVGLHPYRYDYVDMGAARELSKLMLEVSLLVADYTDAKPYPQPIFAVHHQGDKVVSYEAVEDFLDRVGKSNCQFLPIPADINVTHAGVVLKYDIHSQDDSRVLEKSNPLFYQLLEKIDEMERILVKQGKFAEKKSFNIDV